MDNLQVYLDEAKAHHMKFQGGTKSSATKARASLLQLKKGCDELRKQILMESKENKLKKDDEDKKEKKELFSDSSEDEKKTEEKKTKPKRTRKANKKKET